MRLFVIKGLYYGKTGQEQNPTYYGNLEGCMNYVDINFSHWTYKGETIEIYTSNIKVATKSFVKKVDEAGEYYEATDWKVNRRIVC